LKKTRSPSVLDFFLSPYEIFMPNTEGSTDSRKKFEKKFEKKEFLKEITLSERKKGDREYFFLSKSVHGSVRRRSLNGRKIGIFEIKEDFQSVHGQLIGLSGFFADQEKIQKSMRQMGDQVQLDRHVQFREAPGHRH
jgi:hypothetical protein